MAEGAPLLRAYGLTPIEGSNPSLSAIPCPPRHPRGSSAGSVRPAEIPRREPEGRSHAPVAQLDRAPGYEPGGRTFESCRARHLCPPTFFSRPPAPTPPRLRAGGIAVCQLPRPPHIVIPLISGNPAAAVIQRNSGIIAATRSISGSIASGLSHKSVETPKVARSMPRSR